MTASVMGVPETLPPVIEGRGARHNNLRDVDVDVPLWRIVAVVGVSGSGKTSLALGTLYAEGMHRFLESLSTYSRRRLTQAQRPDVDRIDHLPPALALRQRPPVPGPRSTVGTMSEVLNVLRLLTSRLGSHVCPNGHRPGRRSPRSPREITCPVCGARFEHPSAESFAFNSYGACPACQGVGVRSEVDVSTLVPDPGKTIEDGAVLPWNSGQYLPDIAITCPTCHGARFNDATLAVRVDGLTIADVLGLTVAEALDRYDLDLLAATDYLIDMGPGGGPDGGHILAAGAPEDVARDPRSVTGPWLAEHLGTGRGPGSGQAG